MSGDEARVTVLVEVPIEEAWTVFTEQIDLWWKRGPKYRVSGRSPGVLTFEPGVGGRLFEQVGDVAMVMGTITAWEPPERLAFTWRNTNFEPGEQTEVRVTFAPSPSGTQVTVLHRGWSSLRDDHPARHGVEGELFARRLGLWWGELLGALRVHAAG